MPAPDAPVPEHTFDLRTETPGVPSGEPSEAAARRSPPVLEPTRVRIPEIGVDAPARPQSVTASGELVVPGRVSTLGWWAAGQDGRPVGDVVVAGHVDMNGDLGALHDLSDVTAGSEVVLVDASGRQETWRVDALEVRRKDDLPRFSGTGTRRLALVTCGGPVVDTGHGRGYRDNVIAWASPAG